MKQDIYTEYSGDDLWLIKEAQFARQIQGVRESQFTLGNGYLSIRGVYEEIPYDARPGTYIAGIYDKMAAQVTELVNLPNPVNFKFTAAGEKIGAVSMNIVEHRRVLNLKKAVLARRTIYKDSKKRRYDYQSLRFISLHNRNIGAMRVVLTALDADCVVDIRTDIDTSVSNAGVLTEGRKRHFSIRELGQAGNCRYLVCDTTEKKSTVIFYSGLRCKLNNRTVVAADNIFRLKMKKGQSVTFTKVFCVRHFPRKNDCTSQKKEAFKIFDKAFKTKFSVLVKNHISAWDKYWKKADITAESTASIQQNLRFNIYHMLICGSCDSGFSSIGARSLSGEGYRGHVFWDAEIFNLPFFMFTFPKVARNMLLYRYKRLDAARKLALEKGYAGAKFPWESADTGCEETPEWARDLDGTIIKIHTHEMEDHLNADIAYALCRYHLVTGDDKFMHDYGWEMIFETARFWVARVEYNKRKNLYEIKRVIGPDEFHVGVDNNAFTNMMAKWHLLTACRIYKELRAKKALHKKLKDKIDLQDKEPTQWKKIAARMAVNVDRRGVIEQFDGYFKLNKVILNKTDENGIPLIPRKIKAMNLGKTQLIKQPDVLMLIFLLSDIFSKKTKEANYNYYVSRTAHKSSLSPSMQAFIAGQAGDLHRAYTLFNVSLRADISNLHGNTPEGIHAASLGGTWQVVVFGFAGVRIKRDRLSVYPCMPHSWDKLVFSLEWKGQLLRFEVNDNIIKVRIISSKPKAVRMVVFGKPAVIRGSKVHIFERELSKSRTLGYY